MTNEFLNAFFQSACAKSALGRAVQRKDLRRVRSYFRFGEIASSICGIFFSGILLCTAVFMFITSANSRKAAETCIPEMPASAGAPPAAAIVDETGFVSESQLPSIEFSLSRIADEYNIQTAVYSSSEPAHDVYSDLFSDERGVVLYVEEHEDYGTLTYYWGDELDNIFTSENIQLLNDNQTYLDAFTHDRAYNVISDFDDGLYDIFQRPLRAASTAPFELATGIFWVAAAAAAFPLMRLITFATLGLPHRQKARRQLLAELEEYIYQQKTES